jgi:hypothetical protein
MDIFSSEGGKAYRLRAAVAAIDARFGVAAFRFTPMSPVRLPALVAENINH